MPELLADADSRKDRWHPSPQLTCIFICQEKSSQSQAARSRARIILPPTKVLEPFGDTRSSDGLESSDVTVNIRIEAVMVKI